MKTVSKIMAAAIVLLLANKSFAQATTSASATATIVQPIAISKVDDMKFGNVAIHATNAGTVVLATDGTRSKSGGVTLPASAGTVNAASFTVTGDGNRTFSISLPSSDVTLTKTGGGATMAVNTFTSNPATTGTLASGTATVNVGATLNVTGGQAAGDYAGSFSVTVNYN